LLGAGGETRMLLQLWLKLMGGTQQVDQEVSSKQVPSLFANLVTMYYYFTNHLINVYMACIHFVVVWS
jgi:hypothetical protein